MPDDEIPADVLKRIDYLIKSRYFSQIVLAIALFMPAVILPGSVIGIITSVMSSRLLSRYPGMDPERYERLRAARRWFIALAIIHSALIVLLVGFIVYLIVSG